MVFMYKKASWIESLLNKIHEILVQKKTASVEDSEAGNEKADEDVVDADFEEVKEEK